MSPRNSRDFEFKLGKLGLVLFTFGIALLLLFSFLFGVMVGKNFESYPEKIAKGIPRAIKEKIVETTNDALSRVTADKLPKNEPEKDEDKEEKKGDDFKLTFYDKLTKKDETIKPVPPKKKISSKAKDRKDEKTHVSVKDQYVIQVASFKDKNKMERLQKKLLAIGYSPGVDEIKLASSGRWYRVTLEGFSTSSEARQVSASLEKKIRGLKCLVIRQKK
ncbi:MAG TPA: SPOR domain-containing protein [Desulfobacterales bacterium]|nr:SPOR domain-containing protein [Desulfobacterales bacterium]